MNGAPRKSVPVDVCRLERVTLSTVTATAFVVACVFPSSAWTLGDSPRVVEARPMPAGERPGERPHEMVRAGRQPERVPLVSFDSLAGWTLECEQGAVGELVGSQRQRVWDSPVARLLYRGTSDLSSVTLRPPVPPVIPGPASTASLWIYGNNWYWAPEPGTPRVTVSLLIEDREAKTHQLDVALVRWKEWWLVHKVLPAGLVARAPLRFAGIRVLGCANTEDRELYFENLVFFEERIEPLMFAPRPQRGVDPFPGQSAGANRGPGRLPFPTREETILPENLTTDFKTTVAPAAVGNTYRLVYEGPDAHVEYEVSPGKASWGPVTVKLDGALVARALVDAGPVLPAELEGLDLVESAQEDGVLRGVWKGSLGEDDIEVESRMQLWQKSLVVDYFCRGGFASELSYGHIAEVEAPEFLPLPFLNYGRHHLSVLISKGSRPFFGSIWMDWYRSNASKPFAEDTIRGNEVHLNGGVRYLPRTDGKRNDLFERVFVTFSPTFEEVLPTIPNPAARRGKEAGRRLWQESWGPANYEKEHERSKRLRAYGIEMLTQLNHEITWRDGGESFTFRTSAARKKGGDDALKKYVAAQRSLGWRSGLYTNYCDFTPTNEYWDTDHVMRSPTGDLITAWPRCYSPKALFAVEMNRKLAPLIREKFDTNAAYTDVHTAVSPWDRADYDARVPGAGTFAATFYAYGELLLHDQEVYDGHCWSEGNHKWLYAGLSTGNYGLTSSGFSLRESPYLPQFALLKMHPLAVDVGVPWTGQFFQDKEGWSQPENIVASIDQFIAATIAYGHIGWLVEEGYGMRQTCRSYYMLQQLQQRYALVPPEEIRYGTDNGTVSSSQALLSGEWKTSRLFTRYANGLEVWVNGHPEEPWRLTQAGVGHVLPPFGWLAIGPDAFYECSELADGKRYDGVSSREYVFVDGRGQLRTVDGVGTSGSVAVRGAEGGLSLTAIEGVEEMILSAAGKTFDAGDVRTRIARVAKAKSISVAAYDAKGSRLGDIQASKSSSGWRIPGRQGALRYEIRLDDEPPLRRATIKPSLVHVGPGEERRFKVVEQATELLEASLAQTVEWSVNDVPGGNEHLGTIDPSGLYTAPREGPTSHEIHVCAAVSDAANRHLFATVVLGDQEPSYELLWSWAEPVNDHSRLKKPHGITIATDGNLLIADADASRVFRYTPRGEYLGDIGAGKGSEPGQFTNPREVEIDPDGRIFVTDCKTDGPRVQVFTPEGEFLRIFAEKGTGAGKLLRAHGTDFDSNRRLFVVDVDNSRVNVYSHGGEFLYAWGEPGKHPGDLTAPHAVEVDPSGDVFVTGFYGPTQKFDARGNFLLAFGHGDPPDGPVRFHSMTGDRWGNVYLAARNHGPFKRTPQKDSGKKLLRIVKYNNNGDYITGWSMKDPEHTETAASVGDDDRVYAIFSGKDETGVQVFAPR